MSLNKCAFVCMIWRNSLQEQWRKRGHTKQKERKRFHLATFLIRLSTPTNLRMTTDQSSSSMTTTRCPLAFSSFLTQINPQSRPFWLIDCPTQSWLQFETETEITGFSGSSNEEISWWKLGRILDLFFVYVRAMPPIDWLTSGCTKSK